MSQSWYGLTLDIPFAGVEPRKHQECGGFQQETAKSFRALKCFHAEFKEGRRDAGLAISKLVLSIMLGFGRAGFIPGTT